MRIKVIFLALIVWATLVACEKDNSLSPGEVPKRASEFIATKYPSATHVTWRIHYTQYFASFVYNQKTSEAKFTSSGDWLITHTPLLYNDIPKPIIDSLYQSNFRNWIIKEQNKEETPTDYIKITLLIDSITNDTTELKSVLRFPNTRSLYRLLMYDNAESRPIYYTEDGKNVLF